MSRSTDNQRSLFVRVLLAVLSVLALLGVVYAASDLIKTAFNATASTVGDLRRKKVTHNRHWN